jgi:hypothetical protein
MCGIVACFDFRGIDVGQTIYQQFKNQRARGTDGFGWYLPDEKVIYRNPDERTAIRRLKRVRTNSMIFHHRMPSSTRNVYRGCHPYSTKANEKLFKRRYILVHNGIIRNSHSLKHDHELLGIKYVSEMERPSQYSHGSVIREFNDSEALLYDIALYLDGKQELPEAYGSNAFICLETNKRGRPVKLHFGRNDSNPLNMYYRPGKRLMLSSSGKGKPIDPDTLYTFDYEKRTLSQTPVEFLSTIRTTATALPKSSYVPPWELDEAHETQPGSGWYGGTARDEMLFPSGGVHPIKTRLLGTGSETTFTADEPDDTLDDELSADNYLVHLLEVMGDVPKVVAYVKHLQKLVDSYGLALTTATLPIPDFVDIVSELGWREDVLAEAVDELDELSNVARDLKKELKP